jgi:16S rRNA (guanine966-N2)-methyltransferase
MRIISGKFKGKKILFPSKIITRPLRDRVRESIFNILLHNNKIKFEFENSVVLDLFSGSGSFGIECLSRNVDKVFFIEKEKEAFNILKKNLQILKITKAEIINDDVLNIKQNYNFNRIKADLIFIDPPFKMTNIDKIITDITKLANKNNKLIIHTHSKNSINNSNINILEEKIYGVSKVYFGEIKLF